MEKEQLRDREIRRLAHLEMLEIINRLARLRMDYGDYFASRGFPFLRGDTMEASNLLMAMNQKLLDLGETQTGVVDVERTPNQDFESTGQRRGYPMGGTIPG